MDTPKTSKHPAPASLAVAHGSASFSPDGMKRLRLAGAINYRKGLANSTKAERSKWAREAALKAAKEATPEFFERRGKLVAKAVQKRWSLRAPNGVHFSFVNLRAFVRENSGLFTAEELTVLKDGKTRAINGLHGLRPSDTRRRVHGSWHGWTWRGDSDGSRIESVYGAPSLPNTKTTDAEATP